VLLDNVHHRRKAAKLIKDRYRAKNTSS